MVLHRVRRVTQAINTGMHASWQPIAASTKPLNSALVCGS